MPGLLLPTVFLVLRSFVLLTCAVLLALVSPAAAFAHAGGEPLIHVPADHIEAGVTFQVIAADLGENAQVILAIAAGQQKVELGTVTAGPDGHFETKLTLPEGIPDGYAELTATSNDGSFASAWVRVGTGPDLGVPLTADEDAPWVDASLILVPIGAVVLIAAWRFWSGRSTTARARRQRP